MTERTQISGDIYRFMKTKLNVYIDEFHPDIKEDDLFMCYRADQAAQVYSDYIDKGHNRKDAEEHAVEVLYQDL